MGRLSDGTEARTRCFPTRLSQKRCVSRRGCGDVVRYDLRIAIVGTLAGNAVRIDFKIMNYSTYSRMQCLVSRR